MKYTLNKNKSSVYGCYGGVTKENHYIPPGCPDFVPQPATIPFTTQDKALMMNLLSTADFINQNAPNILLRINTEQLSGNIDTFVLTTSSKPEDVIVYTSNTDIIDLNVVDGGSF
jgi:hypothetical protein